MAKFENEGFCPCSSVVKALSVGYADARLVGLWYILGTSIVCIDDDNGLSVDCAAVVKMFSTDPIAFRLMKQLIKYDANADKIAVRQIYNGTCNAQHYSDIQKTLAEATNPQLIVSNGSRYTVIIAKAPYGIDLYFWDMTICH